MTYELQLLVRSKWVAFAWSANPDHIESIAAGQEARGELIKIKIRRK